MSRDFHTMKEIETPRGTVRIGNFEEVLKLPGRFINDQCQIRHEGLWHEWH